MMRSGKNEFLGLVCNLYLIALLAALPLYTGEGYWLLGDTKYMLFRNVSFICLGCWLVLGMPGRVRAAWEWLRESGGGREDGSGGQRGSGSDGQCRDGFGGQCGSGSGGQGRDGFGGQRGSSPDGRCGDGSGGRGRFSPVDWAAAAYGVCVAVSALCSSYGELAWTGYSGWYMGAFSQLAFVGIYFFVSRQYDGAAYPLYIGEAAIFLTAVFGLLHRLGIDPLGLQEGWNSGDWEYSHMLSTLGNINWLCGFYSVALAFALVHYLWEEKRWVRIFLYVAALAELVLLGVQGSQGGLLILAVGMGVCFLLGWGRREILGRLFLLMAGFFLCMPLMDILMGLRGKMAAVVRDGNVFDHTAWFVWPLGAAVCLACFFRVRRRALRAGEDSGGGQFQESAPIPAEGKPRGQVSVPVAGESRESAPIPAEGELRGRVSISAEGQSHGWVSVPAVGRGGHGRLAILCFAVAMAAVFMALACFAVLRGFGDGFGSGRGFLWRIALEGFGQAGLKDKLLGAGPDCYGEAVFNRLGAGTDVWKGEHWEGAVFTNAHNEILSQLVNVGILGTVSYLAIFLAALYRYRGAGYGMRRGWRGRLRGGDEIRWFALLVLAMYGVHSLVSFQQVLNTPLLFLALGLCECAARRREDCCSIASMACDMRRYKDEVDEI